MPPDPAADPSSRRAGVLAGIGAYGLWGLFPLVFHRLQEVAPIEVLLHRIAWSFVLVAGVLALGGDRSWLRRVRERPGALPRLALAGALVASNWLVYIWAVQAEHVVDAALGYYINPLLTVALGVVVLGERLRRLQLVALGFGVAAVVVLTVAYGRLPWVALVLAATFAGYAFLKKAVPVGAATSLAVETLVLLPFAVVGLLVLGSRGELAFTNGSGGRDLLLVGLGVITAVPLVLFGTAASKVPLTMIGLLQYLTPTLQLLCGVLFLGESLPPERLAGFVLVWIALVVLGADAVRAARGTARAEAPAATDPEDLALVEPA